jgi:hypothetical protein
MHAILCMGTVKIYFNVVWMRICAWLSQAREMVALRKANFFFLIWQKRLSFFLFREVIMSQVSLKISLQWDLIASGYLFYSKISKITPNRLFYNRMKPVKVRTKELYYFLLMVKTKKYYFPSNIKNFSESWYFFFG